MILIIRQQAPAAGAQLANTLGTQMSMNYWDSDDLEIVQVWLSVSIWVIIMLWRWVGFFSLKFLFLTRVEHASSSMLINYPKKDFYF